MGRGVGLMVAAISYQLDQTLVTARAHGQMMRLVNQSVLQRWRDRYLPLHFQGGATSRYGYAPRSAKYTARKRRRVGHSIPLVLTGRLRDEIKKNVKITATQHGGRIRSRGYFPMKAELRGEIEKVMPAENRDLADWAGKEYLRLSRKPEFARQRKRKGKGG